ncbi:MAG: transporter [Sphingopyxis sp.]|uniref:transporter n=1 Tax=Sphingopyxis sp. TaxID=1908224 RepID=UPI001A1FC690|nr:transporter [Sphingopyxis sp.]MBJ7498294.1 transporter [Sphingopyxis sp.]
MRSDRRGRRGTALAFLAVVAFLSPAAAYAGPPFLTDDPEPTETGHWEIYGPVVEIEGRGGDFGGSTGVEINYGAAPDLQLTAGVPVGYVHDAAGWRSGTGDLELSAKYRFYHDEAAGLSVAAFPGITLPTSTNGMGNGKVTALLPVWIQKDAGPWSVFGGAGYAINSGPGNRDYWTGGVAVTRQVSERLLIGIEADRQGPDALGGRASTSLGFGAILQLPAPFRILASGGPTFDDGHGKAGYHGFVALGLDF